MLTIGSGCGHGAVACCVWVENPDIKKKTSWPVLQKPLARISRRAFGSVLAERCADGRDATHVAGHGMIHREGGATIA